MNRSIPIILTLALSLAFACGTRLHTILKRNPGFNFRVPDGFKPHPDEPLNETRSSWIDGEDATIRVLVHHIGPKQRSFTETAAKYGEFFLKAMKKDPTLQDISMISHGAIQLGSEEAYEVIFSATDSLEGARWRRRVFCRHPYRENKFVEIFLSADLSREDKYEPKFESLVASWEWLKDDEKKAAKPKSEPG